MFSPRAENLLMPGRPPAAPRSRWPKLPVRAIWADQSPATRARSPSQSSAARPLARRSALSRSNRSLASFWAVLCLPAGAGEVVGGAGGRAVPAAVVSGTLASSSVTQTQPALLAPTPMALKEGLRMRRLAPADRISSWWATSTLAAQRTCSPQALAGWTAAASPELADRRRAAAIRADWAPARVERRGATLRGRAPPPAPP